MSEELHLGDDGTEIRVQCKDKGEVLDVSSTTVRKLKLQKRDKTVIERDMVFMDDGVDGWLKYVTVATDIVGQKGKWKGQVYIEMPSWKGHCAQFEVPVAEVLIVTS
ncbi:MAG: hypothetical protein ACW987_15675 [Candidatus Thorarchaeota archaeon]|jgi:hypothetical protein